MGHQAARQVITNRVHRDLLPLLPSPAGREADVERLGGRGATRLRYVGRPPDEANRVMLDPAGNGFRCLRP